MDTAITSTFETIGASPVVTMATAGVSFGATPPRLTRAMRPLFPRALPPQGGGHDFWRGGIRLN